MAVFTEPTKWAQTLGKDADVTAIPDTAGDTDPSIDKIFPSVFSIPLSQGGRAVPRSVLNGLFKLLGDWCFYQQNGGLATYSSDFDYVVGRVVLFTDGNIYKCIQANGASSTVKAPTNTSYWSKIISLSDLSNFVTLDTTQTISGSKTFGADITFNTSAKRVLKTTNDDFLVFVSGSSVDIDPFIQINGKNRDTLAGVIALSAQDNNNNINRVNLYPNGVVSWNNTNIKQIMSNCAMPSDTYDDLTLGASGTEYTAPADGYVYLAKNANSSGQYAEITISGGSPANAIVRNNAFSTSAVIEMIAPVRKNFKFKVYYTLGGTTNAYRFIYTEGATNT